MRWLPFLILAYLFVGLQVGLSGAMRWQGAAPNLVLLAAIFLAMNAPREPALLGCMLLGMMQDLVTQQPLGLFALSYALAGMAALALRQVVYREHALTHLFAALLGGIIMSVVVLLHGWIRPPAPGAGMLLLGAVYTALLAPIVIWPLQRIKWLFAFEPAWKRQ